MNDRRQHLTRLPNGNLWDNAVWLQLLASWDKRAAEARRPVKRLSVSDGPDRLPELAR